jgi:pyruvate dehydrogenase (quinone)
MSQKRIAEVLVETLIAAGVKRIYGVVGDSLNAILEAIGKRKEIEWIHVRHEETAGASSFDGRAGGLRRQLRSG